MPARRLTAITISLVVLVIALCPLAQAQWTQTGPYGGYIRAFAIDAGRIFTATDRGVFVSSDAGAAWTRMNAGLRDSTGISALLVAGPYLFAATFGGGVFRSGNGGVSWSEADSGMPANSYVTSLAASGTRLYAGAISGVYVSTDSGTTWTTYTNAVSNGWVYALAVLGTTLFAGTNGVGIFKSTDSAVTWSPADTGLTSVGGALTIYALGVSGSTIYAGGAANEIFSSSDSGATWIPHPLAEATIHAIAVSGNSVYAGMLGTGVFRSTDGGKSWASVTGGMTPTNGGLMITALAATPSLLLAGTSGAGVFVSPDSGAGWVGSSTGLGAMEVRSLAALGRFLFAGTAYGAFRSSDGGQNWSSASSGLPASTVERMAATGRTVLAGTFAGPYQSSDSGSTWAPVDSLPVGLRVGNFLVSGNLIFAGSDYSAVYRSTDGGARWVESTARVGTSTFISDLALAGSTLLASTDAGIFISGDSGTTWQGVATSYGVVWALAVCGQKIFAGYGTNQLLESTDGGADWSPAGGVPGTGLIRTFAVFDSTLFAGTGGAGVSYSTNSGAGWYPFNDGWQVNYMIVNSLLVNRQYVFAGVWSDIFSNFSVAYGGVFRRPLSDFVAATGIARDRLPASFRLDQNYPNPFNPSTRIGFALPSRSPVTLLIYNTLGQRVATLIDEIMEAGVHEVTFDATGLASGVYFCSIHAGTFAAVRKLILVR